MALHANSLSQALWPADTRNSVILRNVLLAVLGVALLTLSAKVKVPMYPVPVTLQPMVVLGIGVAFGFRLGLATLVLYVAEGALGFPVFAGTPEKGIGIAYLMGPTGGYIFGFVLAAASVGWLAERGWDRNILKMTLACLLGLALIYGPGLLQLGAVVGFDKPILAWGFYPFILADLVKVAIVALGFPAVWSLLGRPM